MKPSLLFLIIVIFFSLLYACNKSEPLQSIPVFPKKDTLVNKKYLIGKWFYSENYQGYGNGGNFLWNPVEYRFSYTLKFAEDGKYTYQSNSPLGYPPCTGTYQWLAGDTLEKKSTTCINGYGDLGIRKVTQLSDTLLICDIAVIEGIVRFKYIRKQ